MNDHDFENQKKKIISLKMFYLLVTESPTQTNLKNEDIYYLLLPSISPMTYFHRKSSVGGILEAGCKSLAPLL